MQMTPAFVAGMDDSFVKVGSSNNAKPSSSAPSSSAPSSPALPSSGTIKSSSNGHYDGAMSPTASRLRAAASAVATSSPSVSSLPTSPALGGGASASMSRASSRRSSIESEDSPQRRAIREAFLRRDVEELKLLSNKGFLNDAMRRLVWPMILRAQNIVLPHIQEEEILRRRRRFSIAERIEEQPGAEEKAEREGIIEGEDEKAGVRRKEDVPHKDEYQVHLDVERSFVYLPMDQSREKLRGQLNSIIIDTLRKYPSLHYFQGYHDIVSVILLVADDDVDLAHRMTVQISLFHIRDSMMEGLEPVIGYLRLLKRILAQADPALADAVEQAASLPYFSLSWVLTLLSHDLTSMDLTCRIFDFLLSHNPAMVTYLCAALVMAKKADLEALDPDIADDPATLHTTLSKLPNLTLDPPLRGTSVPASARSRTASRPPSRAPSTPPSRAGSRPGSPRLGATSSGLPGHVGDMSLGSGTWERLMEGEGYGSSGDTSPSRGRTERSRHPAPPPPVSLETIFTNAVRLSAAYPLDHPKIRARTIFGPLSTVFTWDNQNLTDVEAEQIVREGKDVIIPEVDPSSIGDAAKEKREEESLKKNWQTLERRFSSLSLELSSAFNTSLKNWSSGSTLLALVGLAGLLAALYGKSFSPPVGLAGMWKGRQIVSGWLFGARTAFAPWLKSSFWWSDNWLVRWVLTRNL